MIVPEAIRELEAALVRSEGLYLAGVDADAGSTEPVRAVRAAEAAVEARALPPPPPPATFADRRPAVPVPADKLAEAVTHWRRLGLPPAAPAPPAGAAAPPAVPGPKPEDVAAAEEEMVKLAGGDRAEVARVIWTALVAEAESHRERVTREVVAAAAAVAAVGPPPTVELTLLRRLPALPTSTDPTAVGQLVLAERAFADAVAATRPPFGRSDRVGPLLAEADRLKQAGEGALFAARTPPEAAAAEQLRKATELFGRARRGAAAVRAARQAWADAADRLHATLPGMIADDRPTAVAWVAVADLAAGVADRLGPPAGGVFDPDAMALKTVARPTGRPGRQGGPAPDHPPTRRGEGPANSPGREGRRQPGRGRAGE